MQVTKISRFFILYILVLTAVPANDAFGQGAYLGIKFSHLKAGSGATFEKSYAGVLGVGLSYTRKVYQNWCMGGHFQHTRFEIDDPDLFNIDPIFRETKLRINSFAIVSGFEPPLSKAIDVTFHLGLGYAWSSFKNRAVNSSLTESGPLLRPAIGFRALAGKIGLSFAAAYPVIFERFGEDLASEDSTTRWWDFSAGVVYAF